MVEIILTIDKRTDHIIKTQLREKICQMIHQLTSKMTI